MTPEGRKIREHILAVAQASGHGHIPTCFSVVEMLLAVYGTMRHRPAEPRWEERDIFILSKGHAALCHYCTLANYGYFLPENVLKFGAFQSGFGCHADHFKVPGVEMSTGSLGHGIGVAAGMALAFKVAKSGRRVFTLIGDGESNEGSVWEAVMVACNLKLNNLTILFDANNSQTRCLPIANARERFSAFGCDAADVDGHDLKALQRALRGESKGVRALVCHTVKGYGCKTLAEEMFAWHRRSPNAEEYKKLLEELSA